MENIGRALRRSLEASILLFLLWGCAQHLYMDEIELVERGMSSESLSSAVGREPNKVCTFIDPQDGSTYHVEIFPMLTGYKYSYVWTQYGGYLSPSPVTEEYLFLFREDSLIFWGFLGQYFQSSDPALWRLYPIIREYLEK